jgi:hypothetical protein
MNELATAFYNVSVPDHTDAEKWRTYCETLAEIAINMHLPMVATLERIAKSDFAGAGTLARNALKQLPEEYRS